MWPEKIKDGTLPDLPILKFITVTAGKYYYNQNMDFAFQTQVSKYFVLIKKYQKAGKLGPLSLFII